MNDIFHCVGIFQAGSRRLFNIRQSGSNVETVGGTFLQCQTLIPIGISNGITGMREYKTRPYILLRDNYFEIGNRVTIGTLTVIVSNTIPNRIVRRV